jgi:hypothetical protein
MTETKKPARATYLITPECRLSFPSLFVPRERVKGDTTGVKTFQAVLLLPPNVNLRPFTEALKAAMVEKWGEIVPLPASKNPIHDCSDKPGVSGYDAGWHYISVHSRQQPAIVDRMNQPVVPDSDEDPNAPGKFRQSSKIYPGMWVRAYINAFAWNNTAGGKGVSFGLNAIQLVRDDARLDGRINAADIFTPLDDVKTGNGGDDVDDPLFGS